MDLYRHLRANTKPEEKDLGEQVAYPPVGLPKHDDPCDEVVGDISQYPEKSK